MLLLLLDEDIDTVRSVLTTIALQNGLEPVDPEAHGGNILSLARTCKLPFSYLTDGQNVPDDINVAEPRALAQLILNVSTPVDSSGQWAAGRWQ